MSPDTTACAPWIPVARPWWRRWWDAWRARGSSQPVTYLELQHLSEHTLRDIGAPAWMHERPRDAERWLLDARNR